MRDAQRRRRWLRRAGRRTNVALLWLLAGAFLSGWFAFAAGRSTPALLATAAHGLLGLGVVALLPWKTVIIKRSRRWRWASVLATVLVVVCLLAGFGQLLAGYSSLAGVTPIQVHVGAAVVLVPLVGWHVLRHRRQRLRAADLSRRGLLRAAGAAAAVGGAYVVLDMVAGLTGGPGRRPVATGSRPVDPDQIPATTWLLDRVPHLDLNGHRVDVAGVPLSLADLTAQAEEVPARLDCTSGWYADATWRGRRLSDLIAPERLAAAASLVVTSVTGYHRSFPAAEADRLWLAVACQGRPLTPATGAPVRLVAPGRRGFWWVKWVAAVELDQSPSWRQLPFPAQ